MVGSSLLQRRLKRNQHALKEDRRALLAHLHAQGQGSIVH